MQNCDFTIEEIVIKQNCDFTTEAIVIKLYILDNCCTMANKTHQYKLPSWKKFDFVEVTLASVDY